MNTIETETQLKTLLEISDKEWLVFKALLVSKFPLSVAALSKMTKLPRSTTYDAIDALLVLGIVETEQKHGKTFQSMPIEHIEKMLQQRVRSAESKLEQFKQSKTDIENIIGSDKIVIPKLTYSYGREGALQGYFSSLQTKEKFVRCVWPEQKMIEKIGVKTIEEYLEMRINSGIRIRVLGDSIDPNKSFLQDSESKLREVHMLPKNIQLKTAIIIFDDTVNFFTLGDQMISARIENAEFSETMKTLFDALWDAGK